MSSLSGGEQARDYWQWEQARMGPAGVPKPAKPESAAPKSQLAKKKLSYHEAREWDQIGRASCRERV